MAAIPLLAAAPLAGQTPERGSFVNRRGEDTLTVERFTRTADRLESELEARTPATRIRYTAALAPDGRIPRIEFAVFGGGSTAPVARGTVEFRGDSASAEVEAPGVPRAQRFAPGEGAMPYVNLSVALLEQLVRRARAVGGNTVTIPMLDLMSGQTFAVNMSPLGADSTLIRIPPGVEVRLATDAAGRVLGGKVPSQGITIERSAEEVTLAPPPPPDYSAPADAPYTAENVTVPTGRGYTLAGTLTIPKDAAEPVPALVLISGSGPQDRDGAMSAVPGYHPFRQIADALGRRGVAVLRVDDRGFGASGGESSRATTADFADDVRSELAYLRTRPEIDGTRLSLAGHSEGGIIAPMVAATDPKVRAVVLMAGLAWSGRRTSDYQLAEAWREMGKSAAQMDSAKATNDPQRDAMAANVPWVRFWLDYDPLPTARRLAVPVLILQGATDRQVPAEQAEELAAAIRSGGNGDVAVRVFPDVNHLFLPDPEGTADVARYAALPSKQLPPEVLGTLADWLTRKLK